LPGNLLAGEGRVLFVDEHVDERGKEAYVAGRDEVVERRLRDGSTFRVIKNFVDPEGLNCGCAGWAGIVRSAGTAATGCTARRVSGGRTDRPDPGP
jgi:hypothetical protein